jgi:hypothetical protein
VDAWQGDWGRRQLLDDLARVQEAVERYVDPRHIQRLVPISLALFLDRLGIVGNSPLVDLVPVLRHLVEDEVLGNIG